MALPSDPLWNFLGRPRLRVAIAFGVGWVVYMIAMVMTVYDGILSMCFQPIMAAVCSGLFVLLSLFAGLVLRIRWISKLWTATPLWAALMVGGCILLMIFGHALGIRSVGVEPETGRPVSMLHPAAALGGYFFMIFGVVNWPVKGGAGRTAPTP